MDWTIHQQMLLGVFAIALVMGATASKTHFCTMGAVSDWINMGDTGRLRAWLLAIAVAISGVALLEASGLIVIDTATFPPYRTPNFAWLRYLVGGCLFGVGMTLGSGCGNKTLLRLGSGNLKSLVVLIVTAACAYLMLWTDFYGAVFHPWISASSIDLGKYGMRSQALGDLLGVSTSARLGLALAIGFPLSAFAFASVHLRGSVDNILAGLVIGLGIVAGWALTGSALGSEWREWAQMADTVPSRVEIQSFTFISPMGDLLRYLSAPGHFANINFGIVALAGVSVGALLHALASGTFHIEWFASLADFRNHVLGGALMGIGGVLAMGCTIGQGITGLSTLAAGSFLAFIAIVAGAAATMKFQYWRMLKEA